MNYQCSSSIFLVFLGFWRALSSKWGNMCFVHFALALSVSAHMGSSQHIVHFLCELVNRISIN